MNNSFKLSVITLKTYVYKLSSCATIFVANSCSSRIELVIGCSTHRRDLEREIYNSLIIIFFSDLLLSHFISNQNNKINSYIYKKKLKIIIKFKLIINNNRTLFNSYIYHNNSKISINFRNISNKITINKSYVLKKISYMNDAVLK